MYAVVTTEDGSLSVRHADHGEAFHSLTGARGEAEELYIRASGILAWFDRGAATSVLDVGLGLGYNALATLTAWRAARAPGDLHLTSLEIDAALVAALQSGKAPWQANWSPEWIALASAASPITHPTHTARAYWTIQTGDALHTTIIGAPFDFVWQDPFSPQKNPTMWGAEWFRIAASAAAPDATLMTYSVARSVRNALTESGWIPQKIPATTRCKRHWLTARHAAK